MPPQALLLSPFLAPSLLRSQQRGPCLLPSPATPCRACSRHVHTRTRPRLHADPTGGHSCSRSGRGHRRTGGIPPARGTGRPSAPTPPTPHHASLRARRRHGAANLHFGGAVHRDEDGGLRWGPGHDGGCCGRYRRRRGQRGLAAGAGAPGPRPRWSWRRPRTSLLHGLGGRGLIRLRLHRGLG